RFTGNGAANRLEGRNGNDTLAGGSGNDTLLGGVGNDRLDGGAGVDTAGYWDATSGVRVNLGLTTAQSVGGGRGSDTLVFIENVIGSNYADRLTGNGAANRLDGRSGNDTLVGGSGNDTLLGGFGNDTLYGGGGNDWLTGGAGADAFVFNTGLNASTNVDVIRDFSHPYDAIRLENAVFTALAAIGTLSSAFFRADSAGTAQDADDHVLYDTSNGWLLYDADGSGAGTSIHFATLTGAPGTLAFDDFLVV
ncbi:Ca2+-binding RTX toxin-like protein, partial [Sinorhizobium kostiense]